MKLYPYERFSLLSPLTKEEAEKRLNLQIAPKKFRLFSKPDELFAGVVSLNGFKITTHTSFQHHFKPVIRGAFHDHHEGVKIEVRQGLGVIEMIVLGIVFLSLGSAVLIGEEDAGLLFVVLLALYAAVMGGFWIIGHKTKKHLLGVFDAREVSEF